MLSGSETDVVAAAAAAATKPTTTAEHDATTAKQPTDADIARAKGALLNDDGPVVDKRQLLSAGVNTKPTPTSASISAPTHTVGNKGPPPGPPSKAAAQRAQRERQTRMMEEQLAASMRRGGEEEENKRKELEARAMRTKSGGGD